MKKFSLTPMQLDTLRETASIGVSHAATALSQMLNKKVMIVVPKLSILPLSEFKKAIGSEEELLVGIYFRVLGKASGRILLTFKKESSLALVDILMKRSVGYTKILTEIDQSALKETGAILTASCLTALAEFLGMTFMPSVPNFIFDRAGVIVDSVFQDTVDETEYLLVLDSEFQAAGSIVKGRFFLFPDADALQVIWKSVGINNK